MIINYNLNNSFYDGENQFKELFLTFQHYRQTLKIIEYV